MKQLPKYFAIKNEFNSNLLWSKYIDWLNKTYSVNWGGDNKYTYYGYDGNNSINNNGTRHSSNIQDFDNNPTIITLEQWDECINKKWCLKGSDELRNYFKTLNKNKFTCLLDGDNINYYYYLNNDNLWGFNGSIRPDNYELITFEQFKNMNKESNQTITREQLKQIYDVACSNWKKTLLEWANEKPFNNIISLTNKKVNNMFKASNLDQEKVLESVGLKSNKKSITDIVNEFNVGRNQGYIKYIKILSNKIKIELPIENTDWSLFIFKWIKEFCNKYPEVTIKHTSTFYIELNIECLL